MLESLAHPLQLLSAKFACRRDFTTYPVGFNPNVSSTGLSSLSGQLAGDFEFNFAPASDTPPSAPEPITFYLFATGLLALSFSRRRRVG